MRLKMLRGLGIGVFLGTFAPALAQDLPESVKSGRHLAENWCGACHQIGTNSEKINSPPDFSSIANLPSTTSLSLMVFLETSHMTMPNYKLTRSETDDVIAYILSLKKK